MNEKMSLSKLQDLIKEVYDLPDDRLYSILDLLIHIQRFAMRALKGIRKGNADKLKMNLLISLSWLMAIANRLHINVENEVWKRFPVLCSYCGGKPCRCKKIKPEKRTVVKVDDSLRPKTILGFQQMFSQVYPARQRSLADAGVHLAEEIGEVSEAIHAYLGQHLQKQFESVKFEIADCVSCLFGVANSANINIENELSEMYKNGCHICHKTPCKCNFSNVAKIKT